MNKNNVVECVRKWGDVNTDGILDPSCNYFSLPEIEGLIGYRIKSNNAVVLGDPVCRPEKKAALALAFQRYCEEHSLAVVYTIVSEEFANWGAKHLNGILIEFGEKLILNPFDSPIDKSGPKAVLIRKKIKHALHENLQVEEYLNSDAAIEKEIQQIADSWQKARKGPQVYLSQLNLFENRFGKRWFYAVQSGKIVGLLVLNKLEAYQGWLLNNVISVKDAPNGTSELLVISALQVLEKENCRSVLVGPIPGRQLKRISGLGNASATLIRGFYQCAKFWFHLSGHESFWEKFLPVAHGSYLLFPKKNVNFRSIKALLQALD